MEEKVLLSNETQLTDANFKDMMLYKKFHQDILRTSIKLAICTFIIIASIWLDVGIIEEIFFIFMAVLGIKDTLEIKEIKLEDVDTLKYDFFENYFHANNQKTILEIDYTEIEKIVETKNYYYIIIAKVPMIIAKDGFKIGTKEELKKLIHKKGVR